MTRFIGTGPFRSSSASPTATSSFAASTDYMPRDGRRRTGTAASARPMSTRSASCPCPTPPRAWKARSAGSSTTPTACPSNRCRASKAAPAVEPLVLKSFGWPFFFLNHKQGALTNMGVRRAVLASLSFDDMLAAAFGTPEFYEAEGAWYPPGFAMHSDAGCRGLQGGRRHRRARRSWRRRPATRARRSASWSASNTTSTTRRAAVAAEYMKQAGFAADLAVVDWATLMQHRNDPALWEIFVTHGPMLPEPTLFSFMTASAPGWWSSPLRDKVRRRVQLARPIPAKRRGALGRRAGRDLRRGAGDPPRQLQRAAVRSRAARGRHAGASGRSSGTLGRG